MWPEITTEAATGNGKDMEKSAFCSSNPARLHAAREDRPLGLLLPFPRPSLGHLLLSGISAIKWNKFQHVLWNFADPCSYLPGCGNWMELVRCHLTRQCTQHTHDPGTERYSKPGSCARESYWNISLVGCWVSVAVLKFWLFQSHFSGNWGSNRIHKRFVPMVLTPMIYHPWYIQG